MWNVIAPLRGLTPRVAQNATCRDGEQLPAELPRTHFFLFLGIRKMMIFQNNNAPPPNWTPLKVPNNGPKGRLIDPNTAQVILGENL